MSVWLIVCILTSRCKNKVTNMTDPEHSLRPSSESCTHTGHRRKGSVVSHIRQDRLIGSLPLRHEVTEGSAVGPAGETECPEKLNEKGRDLERFLHSDMKTSFVTYFETHIDSMENTKNASSTGESQTEGREPSPEHLVSSSNVNPSRFTKKCKTWSTFCGHDKLIENLAEGPLVPRTEINASIGKGEADKEICKREEITESSGSNQEEEGSSEPRGSNHTDVRPGSYDIGDKGHELTDVTTWPILQEPEDHRTESRIEEGPERCQHQGPSKKTTTRPKEIRSFLAHEKFWKYHKNCCDEFNPCQTASTVLKISEKRWQRTEEVKREPPSDDELLEERPSLPLLLSISSESKPLTNPALSSKKTCISLPNLGVYENHNSSAIYAHYTESVLVQDETGNKEISSAVSVHNTELPVIELPAEDIVGHERLAEGSPSKTKLPFVDVLAEGLNEADSGLYDASGTFGPIGDNHSKVTNDLEQDVQPRKPNLRVLTGQAQNLVSYDSNCQDINAPPGLTLRADEILKGVVPTSNLKVSAINLQTESPLGNEIQYNLHLPTIDVPSGDNTIGRISLQDYLPEKLDVPLVEDRNVARDEKFNDISAGVHIFHDEQLPKIVGLPTTEVQSEALAINESNPSDILQSYLALSAVSEPPEDKRFQEPKTVKAGKQKGKRYVKAKSCPVLSAKPNVKAELRNPNGVKLKANQGSKTINLKNSMNTPSDSTATKASQESPSNLAETIDTCSQESPISSKEQEIGPDLNLSYETQLTPSDSYSHTFEDGDEITEWPKSADLLKRSSTISLSSKYDILESSPVLLCEGDNDNPTIIDNGHNVVNSDFLTMEMENFGHTIVLNNHKAEEGNRKGSSPEECGGDKYTSEITLHTCSTVKEMSERNSKLPPEKDMTDGPRLPRRSSLDAEKMNDQTTEHTNLMQVLTRNNSKGSSHTSSVEDVHQFSLGSNGQRDDLDEHKDNDNLTIIDNGLNLVNSDFLTMEMENFGHTIVLNDHKAEEVDSKVSSPEECDGDEYTSEITRHTCNTVKEISERNSKLPPEKEMMDGPRVRRRSSLDAEKMNDQTTEHTNLMQVLTHNLEGSSHTSVEDVHHQFSLGSNGQREDLDEHKDHSDDVTFIVTRDQTTQREVPRCNYKKMENQQNVDETGRDQVIQHVKLEETMTENSTYNLDVSHFINGENHPIDRDQSDALSESDCKYTDALTYGRPKVKNSREDGFDRIEETYISDLKKQSSLQSRNKDMTRKTIDGQRRAKNKTSKTENIIAPCVQEDHKDYILTKRSRRSFQTLFPVSVKTPCPQVGDKLNALSLREQSFGMKIINPPHDLVNTLSQNNSTFSHFEEPSKRMTDAIEYLNTLYARNPRLKVSQDFYGFPGKDDETIEDIRVLANLQFCKVSGGFIVDAQKTEVPDVIEEPAKDPKLDTSKPDDPYVPPSKDELKADDELAVLNIMYTIKKSLELSATYDTDDETDI